MSNTTRYTITTADGETVTGYVQGCGGYLREDVQGLERLRDMAEIPAKLKSVFEPEPGCVAVDVGTPHEVFVSLTYTERMERRRSVPIAGATITIDA